MRSTCKEMKRRCPYTYIYRERETHYTSSRMFTDLSYRLQSITCVTWLTIGWFGPTQILCSTVQNRLSHEGHWETFHNLKVNMNNSLTSPWKRHMKALESLSHLREYDSYDMCYWVHLYISANDLSPTNYQIYQPSLPTSWGSILINKLELNSICV